MHKKKRVDEKMKDERKHDHEHRHDHEHEAHDHAHETGHSHHQQEHDHGHEAHGHEHGHSHEHGRGHEHTHEHDHAHAHDHEHGHTHDHEHGHTHEHGHGHDHKTRFDDPQHAADFDRRISKIRADLAEKLADMLSLEGNEIILDLAAGTGRVARPVAKRLKGGRIIGVDQALAMLDVGHRHEDPIPAYYQSAAA